MLSQKLQGLRVPLLATVYVYSDQRHEAFWVRERDAVLLTASTWARAAPEPRPHWRYRENQGLPHGRGTPKLGESACAGDAAERPLTPQVSRVPMSLVHHPECQY